MAGYTMESMIYIDLGKLKHGRHIPYFGGLAITGPRGGRYILDEFTTEQLISGRKNRYTGDYVTKQDLKSRLKVIHCDLVCTNSDELVKNLGRLYDARPLIRVRRGELEKMAIYQKLNKPNWIV